ncbi:hypothetical protein G7085_04700 [Tessaracoccus sp. HDW20]|uniref:hypothetical protein n=1 Tax=Tessaracoccus coleopterorum TaxID=2714950 RepID=UPI0018D2A1CB|nr:hypothetical protein [Tessaracoccus coleopterorum]NHB84159.1 hypothetical protein [Tessaracoccus coleopterorum]
MSIEATLGTIGDLIADLEETYTLQADLVDAEMKNQESVIGAFKRWTCESWPFCPAVATRATRNRAAWRSSGTRSGRTTTPIRARHASRWRPRLPNTTPRTPRRWIDRRSCRRSRPISVTSSGTG